MSWWLFQWHYESPSSWKIWSCAKDFSEWWQTLRTWIFYSPWTIISFDRRVVHRKAEQSDDDHQDLSPIRYSRLHSISLVHAHNDYLEQFLFHTKANFNCKLTLSVKYQSLQKLLNNLTSNPIRINANQVTKLYLYSEYQCVGFLRTVNWIPLNFQSNAIQTVFSSYWEDWLGIFSAMKIYWWTECARNFSFIFQQWKNRQRDSIVDQWNNNDVQERTFLISPFFWLDFVWDIWQRTIQNNLRKCSCSQR